MNNIKNIALVLFFCATTLGFGQRSEEHRDKIKSLKVGYLTERLDLSSTEAQAFWPVYNAYEVEREKLRRQERAEIKLKIRKTATLTDAESEGLLTQYVELKKKREELDADFLTEIRGVISAKKTLLLIRAEESFKKRLLEQYRKKRSGGGGYR
ncbi:hypothetical protein [Maribacter sp. 2308TA10-17]|uniref:hypothetical protein n=1 Tax=Maribacter sp. 2308TA10-17 TaxID=3386276 RepID=UPI0039BD34A9